LADADEFTQLCFDLENLAIDLRHFEPDDQWKEAFRQKVTEIYHLGARHARELEK
jgi:hypothetical protein